MTFTARLLLLLAVISFSGGCAWFQRARPPASPASLLPAPPAPLSPSPRLIVGRVLAVDEGQQFAIVDLQSDAPADALVDGTELIARNYQSLAPTATLRASRHVRGRTFGTTILRGQPGVGDEVVWLAP